MSKRIYIGNINYDATDRDIEKFLKGFGRLRDITLKNGFGFVVSVCVCGGGGGGCGCGFL